MNALEKPLASLRRLDHHKIFFRLSRPRDEAIMVEPSYRRASDLAIEIFGPSSGVIGGASLERLWTQFSDAE